MTKREALSIVYAAYCNNKNLEASEDGAEWVVSFGRDGDFDIIEDLNKALERIESAFGTQVYKDAKLVLRLERLGLLKTVGV